MGSTANPCRFLVFLLDGAADWPCEEFGGATPLEAAETPVLDRLAREGSAGTLKTIPNGCAAGSEVANLCILSYDPRTANPGRGVLEAAAMGVELPAEAVALRANLITIEDGAIVDHSAGHITSEEACEIIESLGRLQHQLLRTGTVRLYPGVSYRHLLVLAAGSPAVACTPPHDVLGQPHAEHLPRAENAAGEETAAILRDLIAASQEILPEHAVNQRRLRAGKRPANSLWPWAPGRSPQIDSFTDRFGLRGAVISAVDLVRGLGRLAGMSVIEVPGATGLPETNYEGKAAAAVNALTEHDFVYVHVEGTDEAGHAGDPALKRTAVQYCDQRLVGHAITVLEQQGLLARTRIAVLPDHFTPCAIRTHDPTPVPFLLWGPGVKPDTTEAFTEKACLRGSLGLREGTDFISLLLNPGNG